jgi:hypothetical protein
VEGPLISGPDGLSAPPAPGLLSGVASDSLTRAPATEAPSPVSGGATVLVWLRRIPGWVITGVLCLIFAVVMWWHVWTSGHPDSVMLCNCGDPSSFAWFMEWPAYALTHGQSLFLEHADQVPVGLNMLDNTSVLALGIVLAPITWLFGPVASLNVALTAAPVLSGISAYGSLRRGLNVSKPAAIVAGVLFAGSPFLQRNETLAHLQTAFLPLVPLIFLCCYELIVAQRGRWWGWGLLLGLLIAVQFFIGSEILTFVTLTVIGSLVVSVIAAAIFNREALVSRLPFAAKGLALGGLTGGALLAYPVYFAMLGPAHISGSDWTTVTTNSLNRILLALHASRHAIIRMPDTGYLGSPGMAAEYLGIAAILVVVAAAIVIRRPLTRLCVLILVIAAWASLGNYKAMPGGWGPLESLPSLWHFVRNVPVLDQATPQNLSAIMVFVVVVAAALILDWVWAQRSGKLLNWLPDQASKSAIAALLTAGLSLILLVSWLNDWPMPLKVESVATPAPVERILASLPPHAVVLFYPFPSSTLDQALIWQANDRLRFSVAGGRGITAGPGGAAVHGLEAGTPAGDLSALSTFYEPYGYLNLPTLPSPAERAAVRATLRSWKVTNIIMSGGGRDPDLAKQWLTDVLGAPPKLQDYRWVWTNVQSLVASGASATSAGT